MKLLAVLAIVAVLLLPVVLFVKRRWNVTLGLFYTLLGLSIVGDLSGGGALRLLSVPQIVGGIWVFAAAAGLEYAFRRDYWLAIVSSIILFLFGYAIYVAADEGAFA